MKHVKILFGLVLSAGLTIFCAGEIYAHGVGYRQSELKSVTLEFFYSTGEKMSYREAKVFSPSDVKFAAQTGRTDEQGRFAFIPDSPGEWRIIVRDEEGHQCEAKIDITPEFLEGTENLHAAPGIIQGNELFIRALLGVSIIFNAAMIIHIYNRRKIFHAHQ